MKPLIYVAGPYTIPDPVLNVHRAIEVATKIEKAGATPFIPHLSMLWHLIDPTPIQVWYKRDLEVLDHCDALVRIIGESVGADKEMAYAHERHVPVILATDPNLKQRITELVEDYVDQWKIWEPR